MEFEKAKKGWIERWIAEEKGEMKKESGGGECGTMGKMVY